MHLPASSAPLNNTLGNLFPQIILLSSDDHRSLHQGAHSCAPYSGTCIAPQGFVPTIIAPPQTKRSAHPFPRTFLLVAPQPGWAHTVKPQSLLVLCSSSDFSILSLGLARLFRDRQVASRASFNRQTHCLQRVQSLQLAPKALWPGLRKEIRHTSSLFHVKHRTWTSTNDLPAFYNGA